MWYYIPTLKNTIITRITLTLNSLTASGRTLPHQSLVGRVPAECQFSSQQPNFYINLHLPPCNSTTSPSSFTMPPPSSKPREPIVGPDDPEPPFPLKLKGKVIKGFGRGSKEVCQPSHHTRFFFPLPMRQLRSPLALFPLATRTPGSGTPCTLSYLKLPLPLRTHLQLKAAPRPSTLSEQHS